MARPNHCFCKNIRFQPNITYFKPQGVPMRNLETVILTIEELEAYRLRHLENLDQEEGAKRLKTSTSTYQRILYRAYAKIGEALVKGKAIKIIRHE